MATALGPSLLSTALHRVFSKHCIDELLNLQPSKTCIREVGTVTGVVTQAVELVRFGFEAKWIDSIHI